MAQEPSGTGGQPPTEYEHGSAWQPGQDAWGDSARDGGQYPYTGYGQDGGYYQEYGTQQYQSGEQYQGYAAQQYQSGQSHDTGQGYTYGYDTSGVYTAGYSGEANGYQDYTAAYAAGGDPEATEQWQPADYGTAEYGTAEYGTQGHANAAPYSASPSPQPGTAPQTDGHDDHGGPDDPDGDQPAEGPRGGGFVDRLRNAVTGGGGRRTLLIRAGAGAAALAVAAGVGLYLASDSGASDNGAELGTTASAAKDFAVSHTKAWAAQPAVGGGSDDELVGSWLLAREAVRGDGTGVRAYDLATGKLLWTLQPPANGALPCGMSPTVSTSGVGAVLFKPSAGSKSCTLLSAVATATGKQMWTQELSDSKGAYAAHVMVNDTRVVAIGDSKAIGYEAATGKKKWDNAGRGKFCTLSGSGSGNTVLLHSSCADSNPKEQIVALDAGSGRLTWWRGLGTPKTVTVLSAEPAVVLTTGDDAGQDAIRSWDTKGNAGAVIPVAQGDSRLDVEHGALDPAPGVFFTGTTMLGALVPADGSTPAGATLTAVDLTSGKTLWKTTAKEKGKMQPVGLDGSALVVAAEERTDQPAHLSRFAVADGSENAGGGFPRGTGSVLTSGRVLTGSNLVVAVPTFTSTYGSAATAFRTGG